LSKSQAPALHAPLVHSFCGSVPFGINKHIPLARPLSAAEHASHVPLHALSQQNPSVHSPLRQLPSSVQPCPWSSAQALLPLQAPFAHSFWGSELFGMAVQVPFAPPLSALEHAWQVLLHAVSQQRPSTQNPVVHSPLPTFPAQTPPWATCGSQLLVDVLQKLPDEH
jgi:hypothetical protein